MCISVFSLILDGRKRYVSVSLCLFALCDNFKLKYLLFFQLGVSSWKSRDHCVCWGHFGPVFSTCVILRAATVLDDTVEIGLTVFKVYIVFVFCFLSNFYDIQVALWLFCEDEL